MPYLGRLRSLVQGQGGSTLVELMVTLPFAVIVALAGFKAFGDASTGQRNVDARAHAVMSAQTALERMTRELRQARWVVFRSSQLVDMDTFVRASGSDRAVARMVRYDCTGRA